MRIFPRQPQHGQVSTPGLSRSMYSLKIIFSGLFSRVSLQLIRFFRIITMHCETMTPLVRAMTLFGHGGAWRKNFGLPGRGGSSSSFIVCRKDYSGSRGFPQVKKRAAQNDTLRGIENRNSEINSLQTCGRRETQFAAGQPTNGRMFPSLRFAEMCTRSLPRK